MLFILLINLFHNHYYIVLILFVSFTVKGDEFKWLQCYRPLEENQINVHRGHENNLHFYFDGKMLVAKLASNSILKL